MKKNGSILVTVLGSFAMFILILDSKLVLTGASDGIALCLWTVIPSLFPFFIVSNLINGSIAGKNLRFLRFLGKFCKIPPGSETILFLGFLGGYPVGAQNVRQAYDTGRIAKKDASRMLAFCNNAGPAFIFGMVSSLFTSPIIPWALWLITIVSAVLVAWILPASEGETGKIHTSVPVTLPQAVTNAMKAMANVCCWIIAFRVVLTVLEYRLLANCTPTILTVSFGLLELSNGILEASAVSEEATRFVLCALLLSSGGLCVAMQTRSVIKDLGMRYYMVGKILQSVFGVLLSLMLIPVLFHHHSPTPTLLSAAVFTAAILIGKFSEKSVAIRKKVVYNIENN